jgi:hypothetical protein
MSEQITKKWKRKPKPRIGFEKFHIEDLFLCDECKEWYPWFLYIIGKEIMLCHTDCETYELMNDEED